jgi:hypothetical protein
MVAVRKDSPSARTSRPCHFNKEQTPPGDLLDPSPRIHGGCFGVRGTPPPKPSKCKIRFALPGAAICRSWPHHTGKEPSLLFAKTDLSPEDITWMSR